MFSFNKESKIQKSIQMVEIMKAKTTPNLKYIKTFRMFYKFYIFLSRKENANANSRKTVKKKC